MKTQYIMNSPSVISEVIDDEAVILNLKAGIYYSITKIGAVIWCGIENGMSDEQIRAKLISHFPKNADEIAKELSNFCEELKIQDLIRSNSSNEILIPTKAHDIDSMLAKISNFESPNLEIYNDMKDLLILDPIHDVNETGWPIVKKD